jgi:hypothetical protein
MFRIDCSIARPAAILFAASALFAQAAPTQTPAQSISGVLQPALNTVHLTLQSLRTDKWKKGSVRDEATVNIDAIQNDLRNNLPSLLQTADAAPGSVTKLLPVTRHVDALYDVLLRVTEASRIAAPDDQAAQLQQALTGLSNARLALDDRMQGSAGALEKQVQDLRATVQQQAAQIAATPAPSALPCVPPPPARKATPKRKPAAKPATGTTTPAPSTAKPTQPAASH